MQWGRLLPKPGDYSAKVGKGFSCNYVVMYCFVKKNTLNALEKDINSSKRTEHASQLGVCQQQENKCIVIQALGKLSY